MRLHGLGRDQVRSENTDPELDNICVQEHDAGHQEEAGSSAVKYGQTETKIIP